MRNPYTHQPHRIATNLTVLIALVISLPVFAEIFTWTDDQGNTVYSDRSQKKDSREVTLPPALTVPAITIKPPPAPQPTDNKKAEYEQLEISKPAEDEAQWLPTGNLDVSVTTAPPLMASQGHYLSVNLDGKEVVSRTQDSQIKLSDIYRGSHTLTAIIHDRSGAVLKQSKTITFHIHRH